MNTQSLLYKFSVIALLALLLCLPLAMISNTIAEREQSRDAVIADVASSTAAGQTISGPVLVLPYQQAVTVDVSENGKLVQKTQWEQRSRYWLPESLDVRGDVQSKPRHRGIYEVQLYGSALNLNGYFDIKPEDIPADIRPGQAYLAFGVSDLRGLTSTPLLKVNDHSLTLEPASNVAALPSGLHADLPALNSGRVVFQMQMDVRGMADLHFLPLGRDSSISLSSNWHSPSFIGRYLPVENEVDSEGVKGFRARWSTSYLSNNMEQLFAACMKGDCDAYNQNFLGVKLITPVDIYLQSERAEKYGFLFVVLTFVAFFLFEVLKRLRIHPAQYSLVGVALVLFFLLLISLSEHIAFALAYVIAAGACIGLLTFYISHVLLSLWRGLGFGLLLTGLFGALYELLRSEDFALLMGSLLLFLIVASIMVITRRTDWYSLTVTPPPVPQPATGTPE